MGYDLDSLSGRLRYARENKKLKQGDVAKLLSLTTEAYGHYERGRNEMSLDNLKKISEITGFRVLWLLERSGPEKDGERPDVQELIDNYLSSNQEAQSALLTMARQASKTA